MRKQSTKILRLELEEFVKSNIDKPFNIQSLISLYNMPKERIRFFLQIASIRQGLKIVPMCNKFYNGKPGDFIVKVNKVQ